MGSDHVADRFMTEPIAIVGAGLGGLTCALALARAGRRVRVYEQAPELAEIGAGITLSPNASRVFIHLGMGEGLKRLGVVPEKQWTQNLHSGDVLVERERGAEMERLYHAPYTHLHRADLHALLTNALNEAAPDAVLLDHKVVRASPGGTLHFANGTFVEAETVRTISNVVWTLRDRMQKEP